jgi:hypothetical protein
MKMKLWYSVCYPFMGLLLLCSTLSSVLLEHPSPIVCLKMASMKPPSVMARILYGPLCIVIFNFFTPCL